MTARPHCLAPDACTAAKPTTHCRACTAKRLRADPEINARRIATLRAVLSDPDVEARRIERLREYTEARKADPAAMELLRENGRRYGRANLDMTRGPESRAKAARSRRETMMGWCPVEYRAEYHRLVRFKVKAAEAKRIILAQIEADARRYAATGELQRARIAA